MFSVTILLALAIVCVHSQTQLTLPPLPYEYNALEPVLSEELMRLHHDEHFQIYINQTNIALKALFVDTHYGGNFQNISEQPIEVILTELKTLPNTFHIALRNNGGGYFNHKFFFSILRTPTLTAAENQPTGPLLDAIKRSFGSYEKFQELFTAASVNLFGSGWIWVYVDARSKHLVINYTASQDNPIMFDKNHLVIFGIDVWEHAYYPVYKNRRNEYVENFWRLVNWPVVSQLYTDGQTKRSDL